MTQVNRKGGLSRAPIGVASCLLALAATVTVPRALAAQQAPAPVAPSGGTSPVVAPAGQAAPGSLPGTAAPAVAPATTMPAPGSPAAPGGTPAPSLGNPGALPGSPLASPQPSQPGATALPGPAGLPGAAPSLGGAAPAGDGGLVAPAPADPFINGQIPNVSPAASKPTGPSITLDEALKRAQANAPAFAAAVALSKTAALDHSIARAALLPSAIYNNQFLYTQGARLSSNTARQALNPLGPGVPTFIANNAVHEYVSQASFNEVLGLAQYAALARATALAAVAKAELEISRRGLTSTVVGLFYSSTATANRVAVEQGALQEAADFVKQTQERENVREAAHADVLKAELTMQQRQRDVADAQLFAEKARLDLGVLLFADPRTPYNVTLPEAKPLPSRAEISSAANTDNPELKVALATFQARSLDIAVAQAAYLPALALNYNYGIDAAQFAFKGRESAPGRNDNIRNLGYSASATLNIPIFDWFATQNRIRQTHILKDAAKTVITSAQRTLIAQVEEFYGEASLAEHQLASLRLSVDTARESLRLTRLRYSAGESTVLEVVDAQNSLTAAELAFTDGTVRYQLALANLQLLTGAI